MDNTTNTNESHNAILVGDTVIAYPETLRLVELTRNKHVQYKDLDPDKDVFGPCVIWGTPKGTIFVSHDDNCVTLSLHEILMLSIGALTIAALDQKYNNEPTRGW